MFRKTASRAAHQMLSDNLSMGGSMSGSKALPMVRTTGEAGELEAKVTTDFMKLMDVIEDQRYHKVND